MQTVKADISAARTEKLATAFETGIDSKRMIAPYIATIHEADSDTWNYKIKLPKEVTERTGTDVKDSEAYATEFPFTQTVVKNFQVELTDSISVDETWDDINEFYHSPSLRQEDQRSAVVELANKFDRKVIVDGLAAATNLGMGADITDSASAKAFLKAVKKKLNGYRNTSLSDIVIVVNSNTMEHFEDLIEARVTNLGDGVLVNGIVEKVYGMTIIATRPADTTVSAAGAVSEDTTNKAILADGKALVVAKKVINVAKKGLTSRELQAPSSSASLVNWQRVIIHAIFMKVYVKVTEKDLIYYNN